jgi:hypothetical protein
MKLVKFDEENTEDYKLIVLADKENPSGFAIALLTLKNKNDINRNNR